MTSSFMSMTETSTSLCIIFVVALNNFCLDSMVNFKNMKNVYDMHIHVCIYMYAYTCIYIHVCIYMYVYIYI